MRANSGSMRWKVDGRKEFQGFTSRATGAPNILIMGARAGVPRFIGSTAPHFTLRTDNTVQKYSFFLANLTYGLNITKLLR